MAVRTSERTETRVLELYDQGLSFEAISATTGIAVNTVGRILRRMGVKTKRGGIAHDDYTIERVLEASMAGMHPNDICVKLNITHNRVMEMRTKLRRRGHELPVLAHTNYKSHHSESDHPPRMTTGLDFGGRTFEDVTFVKKKYTRVL